MVTAASSSSTSTQLETKYFDIPDKCRPYKRLLAARALGAIFFDDKCDDDLYQCLFVPLDTGSVGDMSSEKESSIVRSSHHASENSAQHTNKRKAESSRLSQNSDEYQQKMESRKKRFSLQATQSSSS
jgi:hypothetical protein